MFSACVCPSLETGQQDHSHAGTGRFGIPLPAASLPTEGLPTLQSVVHPYISVSNPPTLPFKSLPRQSIAVILSINQKWTCIPFDEKPPLTNTSQEEKVPGGKKCRRAERTRNNPHTCSPCSPGACGTQVPSMAQHPPSS